MIQHRPLIPADRPFVIATWSSSYKSSPYAGILFTDDYATVMHATINRVLDRPETTTLLACDRDDRDFLYGYIVGELADTPIIHYAYVKTPYRRSGIARGLLAAIGVNALGRFVYTSKTEIVKDLASKMPRARFDANGIRYSKQNRRRAL